MVDATGQIEKDFPSISRLQAALRPDKTAYIWLNADGAETSTYTYAEVHREVEKIAPIIGDLAGRRVLMLYDTGAPFVFAFLACLRVGAVGVPSPLARPGRPTWERLSTIARDAGVSAILTESACVSRLKGWLSCSPFLSTLIVIVTDQVGEQKPLLAPHEPKPSDLAFLQYTSGSTASPRGAMITYGNLSENAKLGSQVLGAHSESRLVSWLPAYHDLGLIGMILQNIYSGSTCIMLPPAAVIKNPSLWLKAIHRYRATTTVAPNFAYHLAARRIGNELKKELDLSCWKIAGNASEPVRADTIRKFCDAFRECHFAPEAFRVGYGLAEATLIVASGDPPTPPRIVTVDAVEFEKGRLRVAKNGREIVSTGSVHAPQEITIVDPQRGVPVDDRTIGEIWISGPCVAAGYYCGGQINEDTFQARLADGTGPFLRTGDLGAVMDGEYYIVGRLKEMIITRGRNIFPQDIETLVHEAHGALKPSGCVVFGVDEAVGEGVVVVQEIERSWLGKVDYQEVADIIQDVIFDAFEFGARDIVLVKPDTIPRTTSGKMQRVLCRKLYLAGELDSVRIKRKVLADHKV